MYYDVTRNGKVYTSSLVNHNMITKVKILYNDDAPRRRERTRRRRPRRVGEIIEAALPLDEIDGVDTATYQISAVTSPGLQSLSSPKQPSRKPKKRDSTTKKIGLLRSSRSQVTATRSRTKIILNYGRS